MSFLPPRLVLVVSLPIAVLISGVFSTAPAPAESTPATDFQLGLSSQSPATGTAASLYILYKRPGDPTGKPSALRRVVIAAPLGARYDGGAVPSCQASDQQLMAEGRNACPAASNVGGGTVTAMTGFGPPVDPVTTDATFFNQGTGVIQLLTQHGTNVVLAVIHGKFTAPNTLSFDSIPSVPGAPPDFATSVREVNVRLTDSRSASRPFLTTPPQCPADHEWVSQLTYATADGNTYRAQSTTPCSPGATAATAGSRSDPGQAKPSSFSGSCQLSGAVHFEPALTAVAQTGRVYATATGTCTGSFTDPSGQTQSLSGAPALAVAQSQGSESCASGVGTGSGYLTIAGHQLGFTYSEVRGGPVLTLKAAGTNGGAAIAEGNVSPSANPVALLQACSSSGLAQAPIDIRLVTAPTMTG